MPEPGSVPPFKKIHTLVPIGVLVPPSCRVRPPSSEKLVVENAAPPCAIVVPDPLSRPPDNVDRPDTVRVPAPLSNPADWVSAPIVGAPGKLNVPPLTVSIPESMKELLIVVVPALNVAFAAVMLEATSSVRVPPPN